MELDDLIARFIADHRVGPLTTATRDLPDLVDNKIAVALIGLAIMGCWPAA